MKDLKHAFGSPDPEFQSRVRQTLFRIEEKEETIVKKKLTFSMAMAMILCVCIITVSALAGSALLAEKPDITQSPLSHSENEQPAPTPDPYKHIPLLTEVFWPEEAGVIFHLNENCENMSYPCTVCLFFDALEAGGKLCALCFNEMTDFASVPTLATQSPILSTPTPQPMLTPVPDYLYDTTASLIAQSTEVFLLSEDDPVYHLDASCGGAEHPHRMNLLSAVWLGRTACGECIGDGGWFYTSETDPYYHPSVHCCVGVDRPLRVTLLEAYALEKLPCGGKVDAPVFVWSAEGSNYYHARQDCSAAERATRVTLPVAENRRQAPCPFCWTVSSAFITPSPTFQKTPSANAVYPSRGDSLFHRTPLCGETVTAPSVSLIDALNTGLQPCPACYGSEAVYTVNGGETYHHPENPCFRFYASSSSFADFSLTEALLRGKQPCEECVLSSAYEEDFTIFFYTAEDTAYHFDRTCASKNGSSVRSLYESELIAMGKNPCKKCIPREAYGYVFSSETGAFYHLYDDCVGADVSAPRVPIAVAEARLQTACPNCTGDQDFICLISDASAFYHVKDVLRGIPDAVSLSRAVSVKTALSEGKKPCICMAFGASAGKTTRECRADLIGEVYYYSVNGEYYHLESVCGVYEYPDLLRGAQVHEKNLSPCPACLPNREKTSSVSASVDNAASHGVILSDEEAASSAR